MQKPSSLTHQSRAEPRWPLPIDALVIMMSAMISKMLMMITITLLAGSEAFWESTQRADPLSLPITSLPKVRHHCNWSHHLHDNLPSGTMQCFNLVRELVTWVGKLGPNLFDPKLTRLAHLLSFPSLFIYN